MSKAGRIRAVDSRQFNLNSLVIRLPIIRNVSCTIEMFYIIDRNLIKMHSEYLRRMNYCFSYINLLYHPSLSIFYSSTRLFVALLHFCKRAV